MRMQKKNRVCPSVRQPVSDALLKQGKLMFLDRSSHLYMKPCPSVRWSVRPLLPLYLLKFMLI